MNKKLDVVNLIPIESTIAKVQSTRQYYCIIENFGLIIYSQFSNRKNSVKYNSEKDIYHDFFKMLDSVVKVFVQLPIAIAFMSDYQMNKGDADKWLLFTKSLWLRLTIRLFHIETNLAQQEAEKVITNKSNE